MLKFKVLFKDLGIIFHKDVLQDGDTFEQVRKKFFVDVRKLVVAERILITAFLDDARRYADCRRVVGYGFDDYGVGPDFGVFADRNVAEHFGTAAYDGMALDGRMAFDSGCQADAAERDTLVNQDVVFNDGGLSDHDAESMVNEAAPTDRCTRVNIDVRENLVDGHDEAAGANETLSIEAVCDTVPGYGPDPGVVEKEFEAAFYRRVILINVDKIFPDL